MIDAAPRGPESVGLASAASTSSHSQHDALAALGVLEANANKVTDQTRAGMIDAREAGPTSTSVAAAAADASMEAMMTSETRITFGSNGSLGIVWCRGFARDGSEMAVLEVSV